MSDYAPPTCTHKPEDFSQLSINAGQRKINYELTVVDKKLIEAVTALTKAVANLTNSANDHVTAASAALFVAKERNEKVAGIRPPGCDDGTVPPPQS